MTIWLSNSMRKNAQKWIDRVEYDLQTADAMFHAGRYIYVIFMCQQAMEKCLKTVAVSEGREIVPIHNLRRLAERADLKFTNDKLVKLDFLTEYYMNSRYKEDVAELSKGLTKEFVEEILMFSKQEIRWLLQKNT